jgi:hypothetical protein
MTIAAAKARGNAAALKIRRWNWVADCTVCDWRGPTRTYKGEASADAHSHNGEKHESH